MQNISFSQNFLVNRPLVETIIKNAGFLKEDIVLDIGAGAGIITSELLKYSDHIIALEKEALLAKSLAEKYKEYKKITVVESDFDSFELPKVNFKVFANIPFNFTSDIVKKLLATGNLDTAYLIMQKEAALRFVGRPEVKETLVSVVAKYNFTLKIIHQFRNTDFRPVPSVKSVLVKVSRKKSEDTSNFKEFCDFVSFVFANSNPNLGSLLKKIFREAFSQEQDIQTIARKKYPSNIDFEDFLKLFNFYKYYNINYPKVEGFYDQVLKSAQKVNKIYRTRKDPNWKIK